MLEIDTLITRIPDILAYIVPGYIYLYIFYFVSLNDINKCNNTIIKSVVSSYIFILLDKLICTVLSIHYDSPNIFRIIVYALMIAYIIGLIFKSKRFNKFLRIIKINRTTNTNIWDDIHEKGMYLWVIPEKGEHSYLGQSEFCGEGNMSNLIVLTRYQELTLEGKVLHDYSKIESRKIMIDTTKCSRIELFYKEKMTIAEALKMIKDNIIEKFK